MKFINLAFSDLMEAIARKYFVESKKEHYWRCICGKEKKCAPKSGWTNLISHIRKQHPEQNFAKSDENYHQQKITNAFGGTTLGAENIHNWLEWVCCELKPFSFIESELTRKNVKLQPISMKTFLKYMNLVTKKVESTIAAAILEKFAIMMDGWSHTLMTKLRGLKLSGRLRTMTNLRPILSNVTRWSSVPAMVSRYIELKEIIASFSDDRSLIDYIPSARENNELLSLKENLISLNSVTTALQRENVDISQIRLLFDGTLKRFPELDEAKKYITKDATIVKSPAFERGVKKIQDEDEKNLTLEEKLAVKNLRRSVNADTESDETDSGDFASEILKKKRKVAAKSSYIDTRFIQPTSNMVERFFSSSGFAASELRQNISPVHLEEQLYLKANKRFWNVQLVNEVFNC